MYKSCSRCGKIHDINYKCNDNRIYKQSNESKLRNTYSWHTKAEQIKKKANYLCEVCRDNNIYLYDGLETHHIDKLKDKPDRLLDDYNLICLCVHHHKLADDNEIDKDYLFELAKKREEK